ncbi:MAG: 16S rRNA (uracil(1498)-N(3))-methyltransferase [Proteobacteria bacterium]|nr:16S rRNA (uracil(1498)-N(3))-methyltransferase [Pseudomonadota bacterium]
MSDRPERSARFFAEQPLAAGAVTLLSEASAHHAVHVLRLRAGEGVTLFDGRGGEYSGRIAGIDRLRVSVQVLAHHALDRESPLAVTLLQGVSSSEKMDFTVQKATELGVATLQPIIAARSQGRIAGERAEQKRVHWRRVAIAACEQCGRNMIPEVLPPLPLVEYCRVPAARGKRLLLSPGARLALRAAAAGLDGTATLAAGPEGGFTAEEEAMLAAAGFVPVRLGPRVLRTETAAIAALAALNALAGDF